MFQFFVIGRTSGTLVVTLMVVATTIASVVDALGQVSEFGGSEVLAEEVDGSHLHLGDGVMLAQLDHARKARMRRAVTVTPTHSKVTGKDGDDKEECFNATAEERAQFMHEYAINSTDLESNDDDDDDDDDLCRYVVIITTGSRRYAGTTDRIIIEIFNQTYHTKFINLITHEPNNKIFQQGSEDSFVFYEKCMRNGPAISIYHDGSMYFGHCWGDWWYCNNVKIIMHNEESNTKTFYYEFNRWFACNTFQQYAHNE